ncbi:hypothetical protein M885DRAFT_514857 [Pelagophyceae sp. CCMP2097]|nr:hypothetical protein M885DRAFT_514857 [Pelagophyceae sp. CCMP2097]
MRWLCLAAVAAGVVDALSGSAAKSVLAPKTAAQLDQAWWFDRWWPVGFAATTRRDEPLHVEILGADVVVWHDGASFRAATDRCPHRWARLSEGRVDEAGLLECPYHGWAFEGETGACARVPQLAAPEACDAARSRLTVLPTEELAGMIWCWTSALAGGDAFPDAAALRRLSLADDVFAQPGVRSIADYARLLPMDASMLVENVCDPSHLPFAHHKTISRRTAAGPLSLKLQAPGVSAAGFLADKTFPGCETSAAGSVIYEAPALVLSQTSRPGGFRDWNVVYAVPTRPGRCRLFVRVVFEVAKLAQPQKFLFNQVLPRAPAWANHLSNHKVLEDDNIFLHHAGDAYRDAAAAAGDAGRLHPRNLTKQLYLPTAADAAVVAYRNWLDTYTDHGAVFLTPGEPPATPSREALVDRGRSHTADCSSCRQAQLTAAAVESRARFAAFGALLLAVVAEDRAVRLGLVVTAAALYLARRAAERLGHELEHGSYPPPRNRPS